jgi:hypothetical protein
MKAIALFFVILIAGFGSCGKVQAAGLADLKFGASQIADSQWNVYACTQTATCQIYSTNPGTAYKIPWTDGQIQWAPGDYIQFQPYTKDPANPWLAVQYGSNGVGKTNMGLGHIINMGNDFFFFVGSDNNTGQLFSMTSGLSSSAGMSWTGTLNPSVAQVNTYAANGSTTPLAAGETMSSQQVTAVSSSSMVTGVSSMNTQSGIVTTTTTRTDTLMSDGSHVITTDTSTTTTPWPNYITLGGGSVSNDIVINTTSNITIPQQSKVDLWTGRTITDGNKIYIEQIGGSSNTVTMDQDGNKNLTRAKIDGSSNTIGVRQGTMGIGQNEIKINLVGNSNTLDINQARNTQGTAIGTNGHYQNVDVAGYNNTVTTQQTNSGGVGGHYMETTVNGNQNSVTAKQTDNGNKIMFTSIAGNNNTVEAVQKGTGQHYLENKLTGNNNSISALQEGTLANRATLDLTNAGGPASVILNQNGGQNVTVTTTCATVGGCAPVTIRQGY